MSFYVLKSLPIEVGIHLVQAYKTYVEMASSDSKFLLFQVTCRLLGIILEENSSEELQDVVFFLSVYLGMKWYLRTKLGWVWCFVMLLAESSNCEVLCRGCAFRDHKTLWSLFDGKSSGWGKRGEILICQDELLKC